MTLTTKTEMVRALFSIIMKLATKPNLRKRKRKFHNTLPNHQNQKKKLRKLKILQKKHHLSMMLIRT